MARLAQASRAFARQNGPLVASLFLIFCGCGPAEGPALVRVKEGDRDAPITLTLELEAQQFVATVTNTGDDPVTLSPSRERIVFHTNIPMLTGDSAASRSLAADKPAVIIGKTDDLFWLHPGESIKYPLDVRVRKAWHGWLLEKDFLSSDSDNLPKAGFPPEGIRVHAWYVEARYRTEIAEADPFFSCCDDEDPGAVPACGRIRPDQPFGCWHKWIGDEYTLIAP